jgi:hypothetical protein
VRKPVAHLLPLRVRPAHRHCAETLSPRCVKSGVVFLVNLKNECSITMTCDPTIWVHDAFVILPSMEASKHIRAEYGEQICDPNPRFRCSGAWTLSLRGTLVLFRRVVKLLAVNSNVNELLTQSSCVVRDRKLVPLHTVGPNNKAARKGIEVGRR